MLFYRFLLYIYPASFRYEYGEELLRVFDQRRRMRSGVISVPAFWLEQIFDTLYNAAIVHWDILQRDLKYTARTVSRAPGFAFTAILVTALGIGANTAVFSVVNHVLIRPLPYPNSERIVRLWGRQLSGFNQISPLNYRDWKRMSTSFESMGVYTNQTMNLVGGGLPERIEGAMVTADLLPLLGVRPVIGRLFAAEHDRDGVAGTVLLSYGLWQTRYGGNPRVLGQSIRLNDEAYTLIGILPATFTFPNRETQLWMPFRFGPDDFEDRGDTYLYPIAKLRSDVSLEQARAEMTVIAQKLEHEYPIENAKLGAAIDRLREGVFGVSQQSRLLLAALLGASICVLLIACTNLANLFLVRAMSRRKELAVRAALGAGRESLVRQLFTESLVFSLIGAVLGVLAAYVCVPLLSRLIPTSLPVGEATLMDIRVLGFAILLLIITAIGFGVFPALRIYRKADAGALREGTRTAMGGTKQKFRSALVIAEVMITVILLISSGLLIRALLRIQAIETGFRTENVLTMQTSLPWPKYSETDRRVQFYSRVLSEVRALPEVSNAAYITGLPMDMRGGVWTILKEGSIDPTPGESKAASLRYVTSGFFDSLKIPIRVGRDVNESDTQDSPRIAVVSESFLREYWPGQTENPIGRRFHIVNQDREIVGVVHDIRVRGLERNSEPQVYLPCSQVPDGNIINYTPKSLVIRSSADSGLLLSSVRRIIQDADPEIPISNVRSLQEIVDGETASRVTQIRVIGAFTVLSLLLAAIGIHGLLAFVVSQRQPEIGLRIALGAGSNDILKMVAHKGFQVAVIGVCIGMFLAYGAGKAMEALLAGVKPGDLTSFFVAGVVALVMTISGCLVPAFRAIRVDPVTTLRAEL